MAIAQGNDCHNNACILSYLSPEVDSRVSLTAISGYSIRNKTSLQFDGQLEIWRSFDPTDMRKNPLPPSASPWIAERFDPYRVRVPRRINTICSISILILL